MSGVIHRTDTRELVERIGEHVPEQLRERPIWLLHDERKVPIYASGANRHGAMDTPEDRARLVTFVAAAAALPRIRRASGLGLALGRVDAETIICGIDLDHCIDGDGVIDPRVLEIMAAACSYAETSISGTGVHVVGTGDIGTLRSPGLELYSGQRYLTLTGARLNQAGLSDLTDAAELARRLYRIETPRREPYRAAVVELSPHLARRSGEQWAALAETLRMMQMWRGTSHAGRDGAVWHDIICPWVHEHTGGEISGTAISEPGHANAWRGGYRCHHAHCAHRGMRDVRAWLRELVRLLDQQRSAS